MGFSCEVKKLKREFYLGNVECHIDKAGPCFEDMCELKKRVCRDAKSLRPVAVPERPEVFVCGFPG